MQTTRRGGAPSPGSRGVAGRAVVAVLAVLFASAVCASGCGVDDRTVTILSQQAGEGSEWAESPSTLDERSLIWDEGAWR